MALDVTGAALLSSKISPVKCNIIGKLVYLEIATSPPLAGDSTGLTSRVWEVATLIDVGAALTEELIAKLEDGATSVDVGSGIGSTCRPLEAGTLRELGVALTDDGATELNELIPGTAALWEEATGTDFTDTLAKEFVLRMMFVADETLGVDLPGVLTEELAELSLGATSIFEDVKGAGVEEAWTAEEEPTVAEGTVLNTEECSMVAEETAIEGALLKVDGVEAAEGANEPGTG